ncbi:MAG: hypothetical protein OXD42_13070, partial [Rhodospirillaceae bacterium]|nr:hypothetical protein [Rhodospirillaceae bacterium]
TVLFDSAARWEWLADRHNALQTPGMLGDYHEARDTAADCPDLKDSMSTVRSTTAGCTVSQCD